MSFTPIENSAYRVQHRRVDAELGDRGEASFKPGFKLRHWGGECELDVTCATGILTEEEVDTETDADGNIVKVKYKAKTEDDEVEFEYYLVEPHTEIVEVNGEVHEFLQNEGGGFEWDIVLRKHPSTYDMIFPIQTKGLTFHYQPPLENGTWEDSTGDGKPDNFRPENVIGSYAVYHDSRDSIHESQEDAEKYLIGKSLHIYRPKITDDLGETAWADLHITDGTLIIKLPPVFMATASYPVTIDPNFGYEIIGGSTFSIQHYIRGSLFGSGGSGTGTSITAALKRSGVPGNRDVKCALYDSSSNLEGATEARNLSLNITFSWFTFNFGIGPPISSVNYIIVAWGQDAGTYMAYDIVTDKGRYDEETYGTWPDPASFTLESKKFSIYCTYTTNGGPVLKEVTDSATLSDSVLTDRAFLIDDVASLTDDILRNKAFSIVDSMGVSEEVGGNRDLLLITDIISADDSVLIDKETTVEDTMTLIETLIDVGIPKPPSEKGKGVKFWKTKNKLFLSP